MSCGGSGSDSVSVYPADQSSGPRTIIGAKTQISGPSGVAADPSGNIYVVNMTGGNKSAGSVTVFKAGSNGNMAPSAIIQGPLTGQNNTLISQPMGIALDTKLSIYVSSGAGPNPGPAIVEFDHGNTGTNVAPNLFINGVHTGLSTPTGIVVDSIGDIYVANRTGGASTSGSITYYVPPFSSGSNPKGDLPPNATISGSKTGLTLPLGVALDSGKNIYVVNQFGGPTTNGSITIYPKTAIASGGGDIAPTATIAGLNTQLADPFGVAVDSIGNIYVVNNLSFTVTIYPPLKNSTGTLNEAPTTTIGVGSGPTGVALGPLGP